MADPEKQGPVPEPEREETEPAPLAAADPIADDEEMQLIIKGLARWFIGLDKWVRRNEVLEARRQRFYWRNNQYIYWKSDAVGFIPAIGGASVAIDDESFTVSRYTDCYNIYTPYGESIIAILTQNPPGINWQPVEPKRPEDILAAQTAEKYQQKLNTDNNRKELQSEAARLFYTDGRTTFYTRQEGNIQKITAHGVLETKAVPITAKSRDDLVAYIISDELHINTAKETYPDHADQIVQGSSSLGESAYERIARLGVLQGTRMLMQAGDAFAHMVTRHRVFIRSAGFRQAPNEYRDRLREMYPKGLMAIFCGEEYCFSQSTSMDDHLAIVFPNPGDGMNRPSLGAKMVPLQDVFNDELNLWHEAHDYCVPTLFMYSETGEIEAIRDQIAQPGNVVPFTSLPPGATTAEAAFYAAVLEGIPPTLPQLITFVQGPLSQFITGAFPALFGGDTGDNDTAKGIAIQRDQAMGRQGIPWMAMQCLFAESNRQGVTLAVANSHEGDTFTYTHKDMTGNMVAESVSVDDLKAGSFKTEPDTDSSLPETTNAKRATYMLMMTAAERNPVLANVISQPENMELGHEWIGLPELTIPGAMARNKQLVEIAQLLQEDPVPPAMDHLQAAAMQNPDLMQKMAAWEQQSQVAMSTGQPPPEMPIPPDMMNPSIDVDPKFDFHNFEFQVVQNWLSSPERRKEEMKGNLKGIQNVRLHGLQHQALIPPPPVVPPPGGPQAAKPILGQKAAEAGPPPNPPTAGPGSPQGPPGSAPTQVM